MSPSRSKSNKRAAGKEPLKSATKSTTANTSGGASASGYNPLLGTFHALDTTPVSTVPPAHANGRFHDIDDTDDPSGNSVGIGVEYDCVSNNGSWSGESEDPKDKASHGPSRQEAIPGVDSDKREKIRQKNEKKHQRQKERRAQELHERCCGYLMSRKLEALAQQLVAMGFPSERATMALILNEGRVEESVNWLFEGGEDGANQKEHNLDNGGNLKVDISQELARIVEMEVKFKCSKQEVERAIVACEGNLDQAAENLMKAQKQESPKPEGTGDPPIVGGSGKPSIPNNQIASASKVQSKRTSMPIQQKVDDKDINYTNMGVTAGQPSAEAGSRNIQLLKKGQPNSDWGKPQQALDKRWSVGSVSYSLASLLQAAPPASKPESQLGVEFKNLQLGSLREPVTMMQRPQSKQIPTTSMTSSFSSGSHVGDWNSNGVVEPVMSMNPHIPISTRSFIAPTYGSSTSNQFHYQQQHYGLDHHGSQPNHLNHNNGMWNRMAVTTPLATASNLGLFSGLGSNGGPGLSPVDWNGDWSSQFDYTHVDWSLNRGSSGAGVSNPLRGNGNGNGNGNGDGNGNGMWMGMGSSGGVAGRSVGNAEVPGGGSREWSSPFEEKDLFSLPRKYVSSPSL